MKHRWTVIILSLLPMLVNASRLTVVLENISSGDGRVYAILESDHDDNYDKIDNVQQNNGHCRKNVQAIKKVMRLSCPDIAPGEYSISVFHDESNTALNQIFTTPTQDYGFSDSALLLLHNGGYAGRVFTIGDSDMVLPIRIEY